MGKRINLKYGETVNVGRNFPAGKSLYVGYNIDTKQHVFLARNPDKESAIISGRRIITLTTESLEGPTLNLALDEDTTLTGAEHKFAEAIMTQAYII